jgi:tRNA/rRNA methyltransferase
MTGAGTNLGARNITGGPAVILVRPQLAVNIGMCARAMANFGLSDLRLVNPREGFAGDVGQRARSIRKGVFSSAAGAVHLIEEAKLFDTVEEAIADLNFVWATTARERGQGKRIEMPVKAMAETAAGMLTGAVHGVLFGPERTGLENDEVALADAIITFPVNPAYASLNLAQAVLLTGYEWFRASQGDAMPYVKEERSPPAPREMMISFFEYFEDQLELNGFFKPEGKRPIMKRNLRNMFHRMEMTEQDVRTLRGALVRLVEGPREKGRKEKIAEDQRQAALQKPDVED